MARRLLHHALRGSAQNVRQRARRFDLGRRATFDRLTTPARHNHTRSRAVRSNKRLRKHGVLGHAFSGPSSLNVVREQLSVLRRSAGRPDRSRAQGRNSTDIHTEYLPHTVL